MCRFYLYLRSVYLFLMLCSMHKSNELFVLWKC
jgi:hypothetical protein